MTTSMFAVRPATEHDLAAIAAIDAATSPNPWTCADYHKHLRASGTLSAVACPASSEIAGFVCCRRAADEMEVYKMAVSKQYRRKGAGEALMRHALQAAAEAGLTAVHLEVARSNGPAVKLYEKLGFRTAYTRKSYYGAGDGDAQVMSCDVRGPE